MWQREGAQGERLHHTANVLEEVRQIVQQQIDDVQAREELKEIETLLENLLDIEIDDLILECLISIDHNNHQQTHRSNEPRIVDQLRVDEELDVRYHAGIADLRGDYTIGHPVVAAHEATLQNRVHQFAAEQFAWRKRRVQSNETEVKPIQWMVFNDMNSMNRFTYQLDHHRRLRTDSNSGQAASWRAPFALERREKIVKWSFSSSDFLCSIDHL